MTTQLSPLAGPRRLAYSIKELCEATGLGRTLVYDEINSGRLRAQKAGSRTIVTDNELRRYLRSRPRRAPHAKQQENAAASSPMR
jgi:excisionase family DNA binding protein